MAYTIKNGGSGGRTTGYREGVSTAMSVGDGAGEAGIRKPLPPETFVDFRDGEAEPGDPTGDRAFNAEMRWEAMAGEGYLTPVGSFFVRSHAPTPSIDADA